jgi:flavin reductase (DIM6/NTAB) family NADH-FMN oxidoreductase RutF
MTSSFGDLVGALDYPMTVVTCAESSERSGCLVGFTSQCSIQPPRLMVWISQANHTHRVAVRSAHLGVHWLSMAEVHLAELFGSATGDDVDKFSRCTWSLHGSGTPMLDECGRWMVGRVLGRSAYGDHTGFLLEPVATSVLPTWEGQLGYQAVRRLSPGHAP